MKENDIDKNDLFDEYFTIINYETSQPIELKTNGKDIKVNNSNKDEYIDSILNYVTFQSIGIKLEQFLEGFHQVIKLILIFFNFFIN